MDRTSQTYLPILLILENSSDLTHIISDEEKIIVLFANLMEHLVEEQNVSENGFSSYPC